MSPSRTPARFMLVVAAAAFLIGATLPTLPARAHGTRPPFELRFPQETQATTHHNDWGARRSGGRRHRGNDLMAAKMTQVYAVADGIVERIGTSRKSGRFIEISHADEWSSAYIHLNNDTPGTDDGAADWGLTIASGIAEGRSVEAGQLIGWVGDSGNAEWTGSHTHFEFRVGGTEINPYPLLRDAWERDHQLYVLEVVGLDLRLHRYEVLV